MLSCLYELLLYRTNGADDIGYESMHIHEQLTMSLCIFMSSSCREPLRGVGAEGVGLVSAHEDDLQRYVDKPLPHSLKSAYPA